MKKAAVIITIFLAQCLTGHAVGFHRQVQFQNHGWLLGNWVRTNSKPGSAGFESWKKINDQEWRGRGWSMKGADTTFVEVLKIVTKDNKLFYVADVPENNKPVYFEITSITQDSFTCENPSHDFPKTIHYRFDGMKVYARVSAGDKGIDYIFEKRGQD